MTRMRTHIRIALGFALALALMPGTALASTDAPQLTQSMGDKASAVVGTSETARLASAEDLAAQLQSSLVDQIDDTQTAVLGEIETTNKLLSYDAADIETVGTQESSGHGICCPSFACAYADAVLDGTVNDHDYYTCSYCTWTDWGGGDSSDRCVGTDEQLLREAYDQISAGNPTVIHVSGCSGEHWIALIGYQGADDPDHLTLSNFIALDPWDGAQLNAGSKYSLYGDGCEHVSSR